MRRVRGAWAGFAVVVASLAAATFGIAASSADKGAVASVGAALRHQFDGLPAPEEAARQREIADRQERWLVSIEARRERAESRSAYADASAREINDEVSRRVPGLARVGVAGVPFPDWEVRRYLGSRTALVRRGGGRSALLESSLPLRSRVGSGRLEPWDLSLDDRGDVVVPRNPLVATVLPVDGDGWVVVGGVRMRVAGSAAERGDLRPGGVVYPDPQRDLGIVAMPRPAGVELALVVLSERSPSSVTLQFDLPTGATLETEGAGAPAGGVAVVRDRHLLAYLAPPSAADAQGQRVPVSYAVRGSTVDVRLDDPSGDYAWPIVIDPYLAEPDEFADADFGGWAFLSTGPGFSTSTNGAWGEGLYVVARPNYTYSNLQVGEFVYQAPRQSFIEAAGLAYVFHAQARTCLVEGIFAPSRQSWDAGVMASASGSGTSPWWISQGAGDMDPCGPQVEDGKIHCVGSSCEPGDPASDPTGTPGNEAVFGMWNSLQGVRTNYAFGYLGYAALLLSDNDTPNVSLSHGGRPSDWVDDFSASVTGSGSDPGLGMKDLVLEWDTDLDYAEHPCWGDHTDRCPVDWSHTFSYSDETLDDGINTLSVSAEDLVGHEATSQSWTVKVDTTPPDLVLDGDLADLDGQPLEDSASMDIETVDGDSSSPETAASGVKSIQVLVDGNVEPAGSWTDPCSGACPDGHQQSYTFDPVALGLHDGHHTVRVVAKDRLDHPAEQTIEVIVDRHPPSQPAVTHTGLPSGWTDSASPSVAATADDRGDATAPAFGAGVQSFALTTPTESDPDTQTKDFECDGSLASRCPENGSKTFDYAAAAMPEGVNDITVLATDALAHESSETSWQIKVDRTAPDLTLGGDVQDGDAIDSAVTVSVDAQDGDGSDPETARSGIERVAVFLDGASSPAQSWVQDCTPECPATVNVDYTFDPPPLGLTDGHHTIQVVAKDRLDHPTHETISVIVDRRPPSQPSVSHTGLPGGWTDSASSSVTATANDRGDATAPEFGTGVQSFTLTTPTEDGPDSQTASFDCDGTIAGRCPESDSKSFDYATASMPEGISDVTVIATDALGHDSSEASWQVNVDRSVPDLTLSGDLQDGDAIDAPSVISIGTQDGDPGDPATARSGVERIVVFLDGASTPVQSWVQDCASECPASVEIDYTFDPAALGLTDGQHTIRVLAKDRVDHATDETLNVIVDRHPPSQPVVTNNDLPSGWTTYASPMVTATANDQGDATPPEYGTGIQSFEFTLPTEGDPFTHTSRFACNGTLASRCAVQRTKSLAYDTEAIPDGVNQATIVATDALDHASLPAVWEIKLDRAGPEIAPSGVLHDLAGQNLWDNGSFALHVDATDGSPEEPRSGAERIEVSVDGESKHALAQDCATESCGLSTDWTLHADDYALGQHAIDVEARDALGNTSNETWNVTIGESGTMLSPTPGERTARRLLLQAKSNRTGQTGVQFEFRRSDTAAWQTIPTSALRDNDDGPVSAWPVALGADGKSPALFWDAAATSGIDNTDGEIHVRAVFTGGPAGTSRPVKTKLDSGGLSVNHATETVGPGAVNLLTGNFQVSQTDVALTSFGTDLTLTRTYNSRDVAAGSDGMFGPGWISGMVVDAAGADYVDLVEDTTANLVRITRSDGVAIKFTATGGTYQAYDEFNDLSLTKTGSDFELRDLDGNVTTFVKPALSDSYRPSEVQQPGSENKSSYTYERVDGVTRVKRVLAPVPAGVSCTAGLVAGCRALDFVYADTTTATGQQPAQWGDVMRRLRRVEMTAFDPAIAAMRTTSVVEYTYDSQGRLRQAWDPRIAPALKTTYDYDTSGHLTTLTPPGQEPWSMTYGAVTGDPDVGRLKTVSRPALPGTATTTIVYGVSLSGASAPYQMAATDVARWAQTDRPTDATAVFPPDQVPTDPPGGYARARVHYLNVRGREVNTATPGGDITTTEYDVYGNVVRELTATNRARALDAPDPATRSHELDSQRTYSADGLELTGEAGPLHEVTLNSGQVVQARQHTIYAYDEGAPAGQHPHLITTTTTGAKIPGQTTDSDVRLSKTEYGGQSGLGWTLRKPTATVTDAASGGLALTDRVLYDTSTGLETERRMPANPAGGDARSTTTVYYTAGPYPTHPACGNKPQWANLPCKDTPTAQPGTPGVPELPVSSYTYTYLGQPATKTDIAAGTTRTTTSTYDPAGRPTTESSSSLIGTALPTVTTEYASATGLPIRISATDGDLTRTIERGYDTLGRPTSYTDADEVTSTTTYDLLGRLATTYDGRGTQTRTYDPIAGRLTALDDSEAGHFTATYNPDGQQITRTYPNDLAATTTFDETGAPVRLTYDKQTNCLPDECRWLDFHASESIHGQWLTESSELSSQRYAYDNVGRLSQVQDTVPGQGCTTRAYTYDRDSNRTALTTRGPSPSGCDLTAPPTTQTNTYDSADRLIGTGYVYDNFGRITQVPSPASGSTSDLTTTYYVNDLIESLTQSGVTTAFALDPARRPRIRETTSRVGRLTERLHYADDSDSPSWTSQQELGLDAAVTRNIEGIDGDLAATSNTLTGLRLQLANLHGDVVAEASPDPRIAKPLETFEATEFGVPRQTDGPQSSAISDATRTALPGHHRRYAWLGAKQRSTELDTGAITMGVRAYIPTLGRFLQTDPIPGGSANAYDYTNQDPINMFDLDGRCAFDGDLVPTIRVTKTKWRWEKCRGGFRKGWRTGRVRNYGFHRGPQDGMYCTPDYSIGAHKAIPGVWLCGPGSPYNHKKLRLWRGPPEGSPAWHLKILIRCALKIRKGMADC